MIHSGSYNPPKTPGQMIMLAEAVPGLQTLPPEVAMRLRSGSVFGFVISPHFSPVCWIVYSPSLLTCLCKNDRNRSMHCFPPIQIRSRTVRSVHAWIPSWHRNWLGPKYVGWNVRAPVRSTLQSRNISNKWPTGRFLILF